MRIVLPFFLGVSLCLAQQSGTTRAKTVMHEDGSRTETVTNAEARTCEATERDASGNIRQRTLYQLDADGQPEAGIVYDGKGTILYKMKIKKDAQNRVTEQTDYTAKDAFVRRLVFSYDSLNRLVKIDSYDQSGTLLGSSSAKDKKRSSRR